MVLIFCFSHQNAEESGALSDRFVMILRLVCFNQEWLMEYGSLLIRKSAHMGEFALLAGLLLQLFQTTKYHKFAYLYAFIGTVLYAISDEFHQLFVPGRAGLWQDVVVDGCGALLALGVCYACSAYRKRKKRQV